MYCIQNVCIHGLAFVAHQNTIVLLKNILWVAVFLQAENWLPLSSPELPECKLVQFPRFAAAISIGKIPKVSNKKYFDVLNMSSFNTSPGIGLFLCGIRRTSNHKWYHAKSTSIEGLTSGNGSRGFSHLQDQRRHVFFAPALQRLRCSFAAFGWEVRLFQRARLKSGQPVEVDSWFLIHTGFDTITQGFFQGFHSACI